MMVLSTRGVMYERLIVIVGKTGGKEIDMALPKDFIDTNDFTKEQILAIEDLGLAMKKRISSSMRESTTFPIVTWKARALA